MGVVIGNTLRRILLSSIPGCAPTAIRINGVIHEFSTIPGVMEDVTEIVLNLKALRARKSVPGPITVTIDKVGPCKVIAGDIIHDAHVDIIDPNMHICTLDNGTSLKMDIILNEGRGYVPAEKNKLLSHKIDMIPIDSLYSPIIKVNFTVDPDTGENDTLILEVYTNGVVEAKEAVCIAAHILLEHCRLFSFLLSEGDE